jgi:hypothetical protein
MRDDEPNDPRALLCQRCSTALTPGEGNFYVVKIVAVADPAPPIISQEDVSADIQRLLRDLAGKPARELIDQVYRRRIFSLCTACYRRWIEDPVGDGTR